MPFLNIPSGHHQVADAISEWIRMVDTTMQVEKVDIIEYSLGKLVTVVSACYVNLIRYFPKFYNHLYQKTAGTQMPGRRYLLYEWLFLKFMDQLIREKKPDVIICTHALPSYLANQMKKAGMLSIPVLNVYTDLFVNDVWGIQEIEYHLVPNVHIKQWLMRNGINKDRIFVTGIPIHPKISKPNKGLEKPGHYSILVASGSLGIGAVRSFFKTNVLSGKIHYKVLCGRNIRLYNFLKKMNNPLITPLPYIESREEMNKLYDEIDGIVTKPGGVTVSEGLIKKIPIFVYDTLPGQEEINFQFLNRMGIIYNLKNWNQLKSADTEILDVLQNKNKLIELKNKMEEYNRQIHDRELKFILADIIQKTGTCSMKNISRDRKPLDIKFTHEA
jgi:processive 1,2-diacylglycerol beta-glucosyltransferase